jgi:hypothetical protein
MDLDKLIRELRERRNGLSRAIAFLEDLQPNRRSDPGLPAAIGARGRTSMPPEERQEVLRSLKRYWAARRKRQPRQ